MRKRRETNTPRLRQESGRGHPGAARQQGALRDVVVGASVGAMIGVLAFAVWRGRVTRDGDIRQQATAVDTATHFVGSAACASCHANQSTEWQSSQHRAAMATATDSTVLGDFSGVEFTYAGTKSVFSSRDHQFFVRTVSRDGRPADFQVRYTFGVYPLQQYLVEFPDGRLQPLPIAWDTRPKQDGGQRWFHLYPGEKITNADELHWSRPSQNWNHMCADCHSTGLRKNYDATNDRFQTRWAEISVGCEACHGPASRHVEWARKPDRRDSTKGLTVQLDERRDIRWSNSAATGLPVRSHARTTDREIQVCAQCHSRRGQIADGYVAGKPLLDYYLPELLTSTLYHADGQQRGEVYTWGSLVQSKMYAHGVTCSDCHNPHTGKVRARGSVSAVCSSCHLAAKFDTPAHTHHAPGTAGASCTGCHMPTTTYMVIDPRHDHSLRIPQPDLSVSLGAPNACARCHANRGARWAAARVAEWVRPRATATVYQRFAAAFAASDAGTADAQEQLRRVAADSAQAPIVRATALADLDAPNNRDALSSLAATLRDPNPLVRLGALQAAGQLPANVRAAMIAPLLSDSLRAVRIDAANLLAGVAASKLRLDQRAAFDRASAEFVAAQRYNADRADARVNLGTFYAERGDAASAEVELRAAIRLDPLFAPAYVNLADVYRGQSRDADAERVLRDGIRVVPTSGMMHHALGLTLVRVARVADGVVELRRAMLLEPDNARFAYAYGIALQSIGRLSDAIASLEWARAIQPNDVDILTALARFYEERGDVTRARQNTERLRALGVGSRGQRLW